MFTGVAVGAAGGGAEEDDVDAHTGVTGNDGRALLAAPPAASPQLAAPAAKGRQAPIQASARLVALVAYSEETALGAVSSRPQRAGEAAGWAASSLGKWVGCGCAWDIGGARMSHWEEGWTRACA